jgi:hypothetical protein
VKVGLLHPGAMGAAVGAAVEGEVIWASEGRSESTRAALVAEADVVLAICPPHSALAVAHACAGFDGVYLDANAISPARAREIAGLQPRFVDGGIIGGPGAPALYLSGREAAEAARLFPSSGTAALLLAIRETAAHDGVEAEWRAAAPEISDTFGAAGQPEGFHRAAAEVYRR